jgi:ABC-type branched-subunit amino acid transport system ATPase component/branched-subunit amino acid ABC-type transport system permease component
MNELIRTIITGGVLGAIYSLIATGLVVNYTATGIFNFGYGGVAYVSALLFYELNSAENVNRFLAAALVILVFCPLLGLALDRFVMRHLARTTDAAKIVASVGILIALPALGRFLVQGGTDSFHWNLTNPDNVALTPGVLFQPAHTWHVPLIPGHIVIDSNQAFVFAVAAIIAVALWYFNRSDTGLRMRAVVDRRDLAALRGISEHRTSAQANMVGVVLAGISGVIGAAVLNSLAPGIYVLAVFTASAAAVIGRFRSVPWTFAGGLILGIVMAIVFRYVHIGGLQQLNSAVPFVLLLVGLLVLGSLRTRTTGSATADVVPKDWRADLSKWKRLLPAAIGLVLLVVWSSVFLDTYWRSLVLRGLAFSLIFLSLTVVTGLGGLISLAQASFATAAALIAGRMVAEGWPLLPALIVGVLAAVVLGVVVALPALRLGGLAFTLSTLALALVCDNVLFVIKKIGNGDAGYSFNRPKIGPLNFTSDWAMIGLLLALIMLAVWGIMNLQRSSAGRAIFAVRASEAAASASGVSAPATKLKLFALSAGLAGLGGVLLGVIDGGVTRTTSPALNGLTWLTVVVLLGARRPAAAVIGGLFFILFPAVLSGGFHLGFLNWKGTTSPEIPAILFGLAVADLARRPEGILDKISHAMYRRRHRKDSDPGLSAVPRPRPEDTESIVPSQMPSAEPTADAILVCYGLDSGYSDLKVIDGVQIGFPPGSMTAILGANGAGKTTLCRSLAGALPAMAGGVFIQGTDVTKDGPVERVKRGVMLAPEGRGVFPGLSVEDNLRVSLPDAESRERAYDYFPVLRQRRKLDAIMLSGGEQQMLALVPFLVKSPRLLIVDEPMLGLAPRVVTSIRDVLSQLRERGVAVVIADERPRQVEGLADHIVLLANGETAWQGPASELQEEELTAAYHV